jgi:hypothetical protein
MTTTVFPFANSVNGHLVPSAAMVAKNVEFTLVFPSVY